MICLISLGNKMKKVKTKEVVSIMNSLGFQEEMRNGHTLFNLKTRNVKIAFPTQNKYLSPSYLKSVEKQLSDSGLMSISVFQKRIGYLDKNPKNSFKLFRFSLVEFFKKKPLFLKLTMSIAISVFLITAFLGMVA